MIILLNKSITVLISNNFKKHLKIHCKKNELLNIYE